jgi:hypothetical protein
LFQRAKTVQHWHQQIQEEDVETRVPLGHLDAGGAVCGLDYFVPQTTQQIANHAALEGGIINDEYLGQTTSSLSKSV